MDHEKTRVRHHFFTDCSFCSSCIFPGSGFRRFGGKFALFLLWFWTKWIYKYRWSARLLATSVYGAWCGHGWLGIHDVANRQRASKRRPPVGAQILNSVSFALVCFGYFYVAHTWVSNACFIQYSLCRCFRYSASTNKKPKVLESIKEESVCKPDSSSLCAKFVISKNFTYLHGIFLVKLFLS